MGRAWSLLERSDQVRREVDALRFQWVRMLRGVRPSNERTQANVVVVFLHGVFADGSVMEPLAKRVEQECGVPTLLFSYPRVVFTMKGLAIRLRRFLTRYTLPGSQLILVGHSLGGLVARWYVQQGGMDRTQLVITLGTPHEGTLAGRIAHPGLRNMLLPKGSVIRALKEGWANVSHIPHVSFAGEADHCVIPVESAANLPGAEVYWVESAGHNEMLYLEGPADKIVERIGRHLALFPTDE